MLVDSDEFFRVPKNKTSDRFALIATDNISL